MNVLNVSEDTVSFDACKTPEELAKCLQKSMLRLKGEHMSSDGKGVDYSSLASSDGFKEYIQVSRQLVCCDPSLLAEKEKMAFFINVYNCLTIHGLASSSQLPSSVLEIRQFWKNTAYSINGHTFSLDDIEHGILRSNRPHPSKDILSFSELDPRTELSMKSCDPRIHFALVCGAKSCPAIQVYSSWNLDRALTLAANSFCMQEVHVDLSARTVKLSKIFLWYGLDFANSERDLLKCLVEFVDGHLKQCLEELLASEEKVQVSFTDYNWQLNKL